MAEEMQDESTRTVVELLEILFMVSPFSRGLKWLNGHDRVSFLSRRGLDVLIVLTEDGREEGR